MQTLRSVQTQLQPLKYAKTAYLLFFIFAFWGPALGGIPVGPLTMFPARVFAFAAWALLGAGLFMRHDAWGGVPARKNWPWAVLAFWLGWAVISLLWAMDRGQGLKDLFNLFIGLSLVGMAPLFLNDEERIAKAARIWLITFGIFLAIAVVENLTTLHLPISRFSHGIQVHLGYRPTTVFMNENNYAVFIALSVPFLLARWRYFNARKARILTGAALFMGMYMMFVTGSRINLMVLITTMFVYALALTAKGKRLKTLAVLLGAVVGTWLIFGVTQPAVLGYVTKQLGKILSAYFELLKPFDSDFLGSSNSIAVRINMIRNGITFLLRTWGMGVGVGNFEAWIISRSVYDTMEFLNPHNWWIELVSEYGVLVTLGYIAFFLSLLRSAWLGWKKAQGQGKWLPEALSLALIIFPLAAVSPNSLVDYNPHWILLALALAWRRQFLKAGEQG